MSFSAQKFFENRTMIQVNSLEELNSHLKDNNRIFLLLYKSGSEQSNCALEAIINAAQNAKEIVVMQADVNSVRDIHPAFNITSVPTLLEFSGSEMKSIVKGCHGESYYKTIFEQNAFKAVSADGKPVKRVTVYSTPTCHHCTNLKSYLKKNNIPFHDIDVSKDQKAAEAMVSKSGQQGVPQADINGQIIVGFDKSKIDRLLDIKAN
jgi:glutaredoxin-like YruB-family protein